MLVRVNIALQPAATIHVALHPLNVSRAPALVTTLFVTADTVFTIPQMMKGWVNLGTAVRIAAHAKRGCCDKHRFEPDQWTTANFNLDVDFMLQCFWGVGDDCRVACRRSTTGATVASPHLTRQSPHVSSWCVTTWETCQPTISCCHHCSCTNHHKARCLASSIMLLSSVL